MVFKRRHNFRKLSFLSSGFSIETKTHYKRLSFLNLAVRNQTSVELKQGNRAKIAPRKGGRDLVLSEGREDDDKYGPVCPGCGIFMQDKDPNLPGYYQKRKVTTKEIEVAEGGEEEIEDDFVGFEDGIEGEDEEFEETLLL